MRALFGIGLSLIGAAIIVYGMWHALQELSGLYQGALNDPLGQPDGAEKAIASNMMKHVGTAMVGAPFLIAGTVLIRWGRWTRKRPRR